MSDAVGFFSATMSEADEKFREGCRLAGVTPSFHRNPKDGPSGEAVNIGVCSVGPPDAPNRLLIISATHGIEGYAGAAIQSGWLATRGPDALPPDTSLTMLHLLNPWGVAWNRRENEDNVDVFRNLLYCDHPSEPDPLYDLIDDTLDLANWPNRDVEEWQRKVAAATEEYGQDRLTAAIRRGQHHRPLGMTYHGDRPVWSKRIFDQIVAEHLVGARHIGVIDIHTGFGDYGQGIVMSYDPPGSDKHSRVSEWFDNEIYTPGSDADIPDHLVQLPFEWIENQVDGARVTAEILEFGTFPPEEIGDSFFANHHYHVFGDPLSEEGKKWGRQYRRFCYPEEDDWKGMVWQRGREVIEKTLIGLADWAGSDGDR
jgi:hypothetical protein